MELLSLIEHNFENAESNQSSTIRATMHAVGGCAASIALPVGLLSLAGAVSNPRAIAVLSIVAFVAGLVYTVVFALKAKKANTGLLDTQKIGTLIVCLKGLRTHKNVEAEADITLDLAEHGTNDGPRHNWLNLRSGPDFHIEVTRWTRKRHETRTETFRNEDGNSYQQKVDYTIRNQKDTVSITVPSPPTKLEQELDGQIPGMEMTDVSREGERLHVTFQTPEVESNHAVNMFTGREAKDMSRSSFFGGGTGLFDQATAKTMFETLAPT